jgi:hypothetical protein
VIVGLVLGLVGGVYYAWFLNPVTYENVAPDQLSDVAQADYVLLVSQAYVEDGDRERARARLVALEANSPAQLVANEADDAFLRGAPAEEVRALTALAEALGGQPIAADVFSGTVQPTQAATPTTQGQAVDTPTPTSTVTPFPTPTVFVPPPTPTPIGTGAFGLFERVDECVAGQQPVLEVIVEDPFGNGIPGISVVVRSNERTETFFTGLKPQNGLGFADFIMTPDQTYTVELRGLSDPVAGVTSFACTTAEGELGSPYYRLVFLPTDTPEPTESP